jgi:hypothetical protein
MVTIGERQPTDDDKTMTWRAQGLVTDVHLEDGRLKFDLDGTPYRRSVSSQTTAEIDGSVSIYTEETDILSHTTDRLKEQAMQLLKAQTERSSILLSRGQGPVDQGLVTGVRLIESEYGQTLAFKLDGIRRFINAEFPYSVYRAAQPYPYTDEVSMLGQVNGHQRSKLKTLTRAQKEGLAVRIHAWGPVKEYRGKVSNLRVEKAYLSGDAIIKMDLDGQPTEFRPSMLEDVRTVDTVSL